jgi:hypothetical protein
MGGLWHCFIQINHSCNNHELAINHY